jgi:hypothetical protein
MLLISISRKLMGIISWNLLLSFHVVCIIQFEKYQEIKMKGLFQLQSH